MSIRGVRSRGDWLDDLWLETLEENRTLVLAKWVLEEWGVGVTG